MTGKPTVVLPTKCFSELSASTAQLAEHTKILRKTLKKIAAGDERTSSAEYKKQIAGASGVTF
jgi:hypothetical protein